MHLIIQKCVLFSNQKCIIQPTLIKPTLIDLHSTEYSQKFHYDPFAVKLDKCVWSCNTLNDLSNKYVFQIKQYLNLSVFNMVAGIHHANVNVDLMEKFLIQINGRIMIKVDVCVKTSCMWKRLCLESYYM